MVEKPKKEGEKSAVRSAFEMGQRKVMRDILTRVRRDGADAMLQSYAHLMAMYENNQDARWVLEQYGMPKNALIYNRKKVEPFSPPILA